MSSGGFGRSEGLNQEIIQEEELDFSDLFLYNPVEGEDKDDTDILLPYDSQPPVLVVDPHAAYVSIPTQASSSQDSVSQSPTTETLSGAVFDYLGLTSRASNIPAPSPRIEITPSGDSLSSQTLQPSPGSKALGGYRECVSPASSNSSTGWQAEGFSPVASPCVSPSTGGGCGQGLSALDLCPGLQGIHTSSSHSSPVASSRNSITDETYLQPQDQRATSPLPHQRSRSASPHGKRAYNQAPSCHGATPVKQRSRSPSPVPSPHEKHPGTAPSAVVRGPPMQAQTLDSLYGDEHTWVTMQGRMRRAEYEVKPESFYMLPAVWPSAHPALQGGQSTFSGLAVAPLPSFEFTLPSQTAQYELVIQQQPKSHHRAHYETEGSRGAVKTPNGSHPEIQLLGYHGAAPLVLQVFIGTADERLLKPHAFYQVHRITGKTVTTPSIETIINGTKVLEISLEPKNHMGVVIDCVGILKLRNADIELRNGETDIGRKNTRVRLVFRVHIPQPGGQLVSLQIASHPIECSQRSAQEFPAVERQNLDRCSVLGGQQMVLTGQNFTSDSKVVFSEKTQNGQQVWEVEATVDRNKTQANMLFVEVPPYRDQRICHPTKVNFYVINGRKKHSQPQHFIYIPVVAVKAEPLDDYLLDSYRYSDIRSLTDMSMKPVYHHHERENNRQALNVSSPLYHLTTANTLTPNALDEQPVYYQSRVGTLYQPATHYYSNCSTSFTHGSPMASHPASTHELALRVKTPVAKLAEVPHVGDSCSSYSVSRHQGFVPTAEPLGKSALPRYVQGHPQGKTGSKVEQSGQDLVKISPAGGHHEEPSPERITVKQENLSYAYLEDVNDIIRRDMKSHNGD